MTQIETNLPQPPPLPPLGFLRHLGAAGPVDPRVGGRLIQMQQVMLSSGGHCMGLADWSAWPLTAVLMNMGDGVVVVAPFAPEHLEHWVLARRTELAETKGLILVGSLPPTAPVVQAAFARVGGNLAYVEAASGAFRIHRSWVDSPPIFQQSQFQRLVQPFAGPWQQIDCLHRFHEDVTGHVETQRFFSASRSASGKPPEPVLYAIIGACVAVFAILSYLGKYDLAVAWGANSGLDVRQGQWWRLITCAFLHGGILHLLLNMMALYYSGQLLGVLQGRGRLLAIYFFSAITGSLASIAWNPTGTSVGASGAVFGLFGGVLGVLIRYYRQFPPPLRLALRKWLVTILFYNLLFSFLPMVDWAAHAGGLAGGLVLALVVARSPVRPERLPAWAIAGIGVVLLAAAALGTAAIRAVPVYAGGPHRAHVEQGPR